MKPSMPFLPLAVTVPLRERDTVPMRSVGGGGNDVAATEGENAVEDAAVTKDWESP